MQATKQTPISLMVFRNEDSCWATLQAPSPRTPVRFQLNEEALRELTQTLVSLERLRLMTPDSPESSDQDDTSWEVLCERVFDLLFPERIKSAIRNAGRAQLILQLDRDLLDLPWEYAFDGEHYLAIKFAMARQVIADEAMQAPKFEAKAERLGVLLIINDAHYDSVFEELQIARKTQANADAFDLTIKAAREITAPSLRQALGQYTVIHYIGPIISDPATAQHPHWEIGADNVGISGIVSSSGACGLVVSEPCLPPGYSGASACFNLAAFAAASSGGTVSHIINAADISHRARVAFMVQLYAGLSQGGSLGTVLTRARESLLTASGAGWASYQLYGDPRARLVTRTENSCEEHRQLTVMFCDIVESTRLSESLDVEDERTLLKRYQEHCASIFSHHDGRVHQYRGDGMVVYFGYPIAYEHSTRQAIRAGIELTASFEELFEGHRLRVRVGIHVGPVVITEMGGNATATGLTVAYADRLQGVAPCNGVVISHEAYRLVEGEFEVKPLGKRSLKGISAPRDCYMILRETEPLVAPGQAVSQRSTPFFGRENEIAFLKQERMSLAPGRPRVVLISGEAGIGKSRLIREFGLTLESEDIGILEYRGSPYFQNSAMYPIIQGLRHILKIQDEWGVDRKLAAIEDFMPGSLGATEAVSAIATLLSIPYEHRYSKLADTAERRKRQIRDGLVSWLVREATRKPTYIMVEDVHWMDPSSIEFLGQLSEHVSDASILIVMTYRKEGTSTWTCPFPARSINLGNLSSDSARSIVVSSQGADKLPDETVELLVRQTDGVPLFIEESTRMAIEYMAKSDGDGTRVGSRQAAGIDIPATLKDLLMRRLDELGSAKETAQLGATIGREFTFDILLAVSHLGESELSLHLSSLVDSGLVALRSSGPKRYYTFKHALVRDEAYRSLLTDTRRALHTRIAAVLDARGSGPQAAEAELLAYHYTEAGDLERAIVFLIEAGRLARRRSAHMEAINHYLQIVDLLAALPTETALDVARLQLQAQLALGKCYATVEGYSAEVVVDRYQQAELIARDLGDNDALLQVRFGMEALHFMRGNFNRAYEIAELCRVTAEAARGSDCGDGSAAKLCRFRDDLNLAQAHLAIGNVLFHRAEFGGAMLHMERCVALCHSIPARQRRLSQDPEVMCTVYQAWFAWESGYPDQALAKVSNAVSLAKAGAHPFSIGVALAFHACIHFFRREYSQVIEKASESIQICEEQSFLTWLAWAKVLKGRATVEFPMQQQVGINEIREGLQLWDRSGAIVTRPFTLALLAEAYQLNGETVKALELVDKAYKTVQRFGERYYEPEIKRLYGRLQLEVDPQQGKPVHSSAELWFLDAIEVADKRQMRSSALRAATELSELHLQREQRSKAIDQLQSRLLWFSEGHNTGDLIAARTLLQQIMDENDPLPARAAVAETDGLMS